MQKYCVFHDKSVIYKFQFLDKKGRTAELIPKQIPMKQFNINAAICQFMCISIFRNVILLRDLNCK